MLTKYARDDSEQVFFKIMCKWKNGKKFNFFIRGLIVLGLKLTCTCSSSGNVGLAADGIKKPIRYFESKTDTFVPRSFS